MVTSTVTPAAPNWYVPVEERGAGGGSASLTAVRLTGENRARSHPDSRGNAGAVMARICCPTTPDHPEGPAATCVLGPWRNLADGDDLAQRAGHPPARRSRRVVDSRAWAGHHRHEEGRGRQRRPGLGRARAARRTPPPTSSAATSRWARVAVVEPQAHVAGLLSRYQLGSPTGLIRLMIQQSNCFLVVERGVGMQNMMQERALAKSGELRQDSNMGGGQMVDGRLHHDAGRRVLGGQCRRRGRRRSAGSAAVRARRTRRSARWPAASSSRRRRRACCSPTPARACRSRRRRAAPEGRLPPGRPARGGGGGGRGARRLQQHQRGQGDRGQPRRQLQRHRARRARQPEPAARRRHRCARRPAGGVKAGGDVFNEGDVLRPKIANVQAARPAVGRTPLPSRRSPRATS